MNINKRHIDYDLKEEPEECGEPCSPDNPCDECVEYWQRMIDEGYWDDERKQWTQKGWNDITRL